MPFMKHIIEPTNISQCPIPPGEPNELECLSNLTLANVIRQLSSLGQHAGRIFDELVQDAVKLNSRSLILTQRIETLKQKCAQLDIQNEEVNIDDINTRKQFKNAVKIDQKVVSRTSMPEAMRMMYENADPPPSLDKLNQFRTDGKDCMKYYTDPGFFFDIWYNGLIKDNETRKNEKKKRNKTKDKNLIKSPIVEQDQIYIIQHQNQQPLKQQQQQQTNTIQAQLYQEQIQQKSYYINQSNDQLPHPPEQLLQPMNNYQIYAESNQFNNGNRSNKLIIQQAKLNNDHHHRHSYNERPGLPPPPVPEHNNHISDLQQIQQQLIRKFDRGLIPNEENIDTADLPPPPSPPNLKHNIVQLTMTQQQISNLVINQKLDTPDSVFDMPLPPPPIELQETNLDPPIPPNLMSSSHPPLPPPPPLPPLVESDTASSSSSSLSAPLNNNNNNSTKRLEETKSTRSFLDDINKGRFVLKPTQKDNEIDENRRKTNNINNDDNRESLQPFVNNSDVAAIIDFVRKFRPHVRDSSDEDEENSDWDD